jgi:molybdate transport system ATP-binding protein
MSLRLELRRVRVPLAEFTLEVDLVLDRPVTTLFGPSGAGKTTLLEVIAGLRPAASGVIACDGEILTDADDGSTFVSPANRKIGYVPQDGALFPHLSVQENLRYGWRPGGPAWADVVAALEIGTLLGRSVRELSGGERRRVALGRALLAAPRLLLLDEPLAGLDDALRDRLGAYLRRVRETFGVPMIQVTHAADEVVSLSDDVVVMAAGRVIRRGPPAELFVPTGEPQYRLRT